jgi:hypothetical protein
MERVETLSDEERQDVASTRDHHHTASQKVLMAVAA